LSEYCPSVFYQLCPADAGFPRTEFELKQLNVDGIPYKKYILTLNCYDKHRCEVIDDYLDALIAAVDRTIQPSTDYFYHFFYQNDRQVIAEADKSLKRIMLTFEVRVYVRSE
jgi:hypothetical protein